MSTMISCSRTIMLISLLVASSQLCAQQSEDKPYFVVAEMPRFSAEECEGETNEFTRKSCSQRKLEELISSYLEYPSTARANGVEGTVVVSFVVEKDGTFSDYQLRRDIGAGCGKAAIDVLKKILAEGHRFLPGIQNGETVRVYHNQLVKFTL